MGFQLKELLRTLCCNNEWLYGILWRARSRDSMLLVPEEAYCDEHIAVVIEKMLHQVHVLGEGIIGQVAYSGKHRWIFSDTYRADMNQEDLVNNHAGFQDTAEWNQQFLAGMKTIALIPVSPQSVLQFGSHQKIGETLEFVHHTKNMFLQLESLREPFLSGTHYKAYNSSYDGLDESFASIIATTNASTSYQDIKLQYPPTLSSGALPSGLPHESMKTCASAQVILQSPNMHSPQIVQESRSDANHLGPSSPTSNTRSSAVSSLVSIEQQLLTSISFHGPPSVAATSSIAIGPFQNAMSNFSVLPSRPIDTVCNATRNAGLGVMELVNEGQTQFQEESTSFQSIQERSKLQEPTLVNHHTNKTPQWTPSVQVNSCLTIPHDGDILQALGVSSVSSEFARLDSISATMDQVVKKPSFSNSVNPLAEIYDGKEVSDNLFESLGDLSNCQQLEGWDDIPLPIGSNNLSSVSACVSECISELDVGTANDSCKGFLRGFGVEHLLDAVVTHVNPAPKHNSDNHSSISTIAKAGSSSGYQNPVPLPGFCGLSGSLDSFRPQCSSEKAPYTCQKDALSKSFVSSWISSSYSDSGVTMQPKRSEEPAKSMRKRARPGESTRPRPKDRQQIQDRVKELREIVPNGAKCSIDALLDRTIKHMLFLQSVTKYADKLKQADEPKMINKENGVVLKDNSSGSSGGATWAFEVGGQTMVCPIIVEDLNPPGQMLVEMLCEKRGFFLEIAEIIRGFGLTILKGVVEARDDKIWARFVVEANKEVTRMDIFLSLVQLLQQTTTSSISSASQPTKGPDSGDPVFTTAHQQCPVTLPVSVADRLQ
ncbi:transcription factor LHW-like [Aristolochia californica]|uniref:transcription factor LHW-like n=1 Tax=Aristolochia californica TaxID=171875 RepID=UPI0035DEE38A